MAAAEDGLQDGLLGVGPASLRGVMLFLDIRGVVQARWTAAALKDAQDGGDFWLGVLERLDTYWRGVTLSTAFWVRWGVTERFEGGGSWVRTGAYLDAALARRDLLALKKVR